MYQKTECDFWVRWKGNIEKHHLRYRHLLLSSFIYTWVFYDQDESLTL